MSYRAIVIALSALAAFTPARASAQPTRSEPNAPAIIPLRRGPAHLRTIQVRVGADTADYLFDTGGGVTVISPRDSAALGCTRGGKMFGVRLTGEALSGRGCANVTLGVGPLEVTGDAGVLDLAKLLGPGAPAVRGQISLMSFAHRLLTVDLAHDRLILETPASLAARVRTMTPVDVRLATGEGGGALGAFVGVRAPSGAELWFEWDSENNGSTLIAPYAAALFGADSTASAADVHLPLARGTDVTVPVRLKGDMIHDGVLSAAFIERAVWTVDLDRGRMWVGPVAPTVALPALANGAVTPPTVNPVGIYETTVMVGARAQHATVEITRVNGTLIGHSRAVGEDDVVELRDIAMNGNELSYRIMMPNPAPMHLTFDGVTATGTWGDGGEKRGGTATAVKRT
jgi:hypothetical protein